VNLTLLQAAAFIGCSTARLRRLAHDRKVPSYKTGKRWMFPQDMLQDWVKKQATCHSTKEPDPLTGGSALAAILDVQLAQPTARRPRNSSASLQTDSGDSESWGTRRRLAGQKLPNDI
jgi:excisionase family DNA binding protein